MKMKQKQTIPRNKSLAHINNLEDLQAEIKRVKAGLKNKQQDLELRWQRLPSEAIKATLGNAVPFFLNNAVASKTWGLVRNAGSLLFSATGKGQGDLKSTLLNSAKQVGLFAAIRGLYNLWRRK